MAEEKKIWEIMPSPVGRPRSIDSPKTLWKKFIDYCKWVDDTPWQDKSASNSKNVHRSEVSEADNNGVRQDIRLCQRPYILYEFCSFAGIYKWGDFRRNYIEKEGFLEVICAIENTIKSQQLTGAILKRYDSNLVARLNDIADRQISEITGKDGKDFEFPKLTKEDIETIIKINSSIG